MLRDLLTNFEIQKYNHHEPKFNGVCSRNNLPEIKDGAYPINLDQFKSIGTHWIALCDDNNNNNNNNNNLTYFDSFAVEYIPKEIKKSYEKKWNNEYLQNTSIQYDNVWILLYWIYWFSVKM